VLLLLLLLLTIKFDEEKSVHIVGF